MTIFLGGIPTEPQIKLLRDTYHDLPEGKLIPYAEVEALLECSRKASRFAVVTRRWRKLTERLTGVIIGTTPAVGFIVLSDAQKLNLSGDKLSTAVRMTRRSAVVLSRVERSKLTQEELGRANFLQHTTASLLSTAQLRNNTQLPTL